MPDPDILSNKFKGIEYVDFKDKNSVRLNEKSPDFESEAFRNVVCYNQDVSNQSLADPRIKHNSGFVMSNLKSQVTHSLSTVINSLECISFYQIIYLTLLFLQRKENHDHI